MRVRHNASDLGAHRPLAEWVSGQSSGQGKLREPEKDWVFGEDAVVGMVDSMPAMLFQYLLDGQNGRFVFASEGAFLVCGLDPAVVVSDLTGFLSLLDGQEKKAFLSSRDRSAGTLGEWHWSGRISLGDQGGRQILLRAVPRRAGKGGVLWNGLVFSLSGHGDSALEQERKRIAREIHDELGQALTALRIDVAWLSERVSRDGAVGERLQSMSDILEGTVDSVRRIAAHLRPGLLDDLGLAASIEWLADQFTARSGIRCQVIVDHGGLTLDERLSVCIYRIIQEALTNVVRHSGASDVEVGVQDAGNGGLLVEISDNGVGVDPHAQLYSYGLRRID